MTGRVFLFTDIQRSTRLWSDHTAAMAEAVSEHNRAIESIVADHDGQVLKNTGDGVLAVFDDGAIALVAALNVQRWLETRVWTGVGHLRGECLADEVDEPQRGERGVRGGLDDQGTPGRESRSELVGGEQERVVVAGDPDDDPDGPAHPEPEQALSARQQVEGHRLTVKARDLLGCGRQGQQGAVHLHSAVDERLTRLQDEQLLELTAPLRNGAVRLRQRSPTDV